MKGYWRQSAQIAILREIEKTEGMAIKAREDAIRKAYPFGVRVNHPYQVWLSEVRIAKQYIKGEIPCYPYQKARKPRPSTKKITIHPDQLSLFP